MSKRDDPTGEHFFALKTFRRNGSAVVTLVGGMRRHGGCAIGPEIPLEPSHAHSDSTRSSGAPS